MRKIRVSSIISPMKFWVIPDPIPADYRELESEIHRRVSYESGSSPREAMKLGKEVAVNVYHGRRDKKPHWVRAILLDDSRNSVFDFPSFGGKCGKFRLLDSGRITDYIPLEEGVRMLPECGYESAKKPLTRTLILKGELLPISRR